MIDRTAHNVAALESLLPLLECHLERHGRLVSKAQWQSTYEVQTGSPPTPERDCWLKCTICDAFRTRNCTVREEGWASEWQRLRKQYPDLRNLECMGGLLDQLAYEHLRWRLAIYREFIQPWSDWERDRRATWAAEGVRWLAERIDWYLPTVTPKGMLERTAGAKDRDIIELRIEGLSYHAIAKQLHCSKTTVRAVLAGKDVRRGRVET
jgi:hypothetical protein